MDAGKTNLILKPMDDTEASDTFKAKILKELQGFGRIEACFDDSLKNLLSLKAVVAEATMFFLDTHGGSKDAAPPGIYVVKDFTVAKPAPTFNQVSLPSLDTIIPHPPAFDSAPSNR